MNIPQQIQKIDLLIEQHKFAIDILNAMETSLIRATIDPDNADTYLQNKETFNNQYENLIDSMMTSHYELENVLNQTKPQTKP